MLGRGLKQPKKSKREGGRQKHSQRERLTFASLESHLWPLHTLVSGSTCVLLADVRQVVVAWDIVPPADLMRHQHHAVLAARKEIIWLVFSPVLVLLGNAERWQQS